MTEERAEATEVAQAPESTPDDLSKRIAGLEKEVETARAEAKAHQKFGATTKAELDKQRGQDAKIELIETRLGVATEMLAELIDKNEYEPEEKARRRSDEYLSRIDKSKAELSEGVKKANSDRYMAIAQEADALLKTVGLEMDKSPEVMIAWNKFLLNDPDGGLEEVKRVVAKKTDAKTEPKVDIDQLVEEKARAILEERGQLVTDTGSPSTGSGNEVYTKADAERLVREGKLSVPQIYELQKQGKLVQ